MSDKVKKKVNWNFLLKLKISETVGVLFIISIISRINPEKNLTG